MSRAAPLRSEKSTTVRIEKEAVRLQLVRGGMRVASAVVPRLAARWAGKLFLTPPIFRRPAREAALLATGTPLPVPFGGRRLAAWSWGSGPAVVLLHGWGGRGAQLGSFVKPLVDAGLRAVAFDAPGHGDSDGRQSSLPELMAGLRAVVGAAGDTRGVIAHSLGGAATVLALMQGLPVERAVLIATPSDMPAAGSRFARLVGASPSVEQRMLRNVARLLDRPWDDFEILSRCGAMAAPLLLVHDEGDANIELREAEALARAWPGAQLVTTTGLGHYRILRDEGVVRRAIEFLSPSSL